MSHISSYTCICISAFMLMLQDLITKLKCNLAAALNTVAIKIDAFQGLCILFVRLA